MNFRFAAVFSSLIILGGCHDGTFHTSGGGGSISPIRKVTQSVAVKVLGKGAFSVDPFIGSDIKTPGIFRILDDGQFAQICEFDTSQQSKISGMRSETIQDTEIVEDSISPINIRVTYLTNTVELPYRKIKVSGYNIKRVYSGNSNSPSRYILDNLGDDCPDVLSRNRPYVIVTEVATADNVETVSGGGTANIAFGLGPVAVNTEIVEADEQRRRNRVFAIRGEVIN